MSRLALSMSDRTELLERLALVGRVIKLQWMVTWSLRLLIAGLALDCAWLLGARFLPYTVRPPLLLVAPALLAIAGLIGAAVWRMPASVVARRADQTLGLKERLITALELQRQPASTSLAAVQLRDAVEHIRRYEALDVFPVRLPGRELNILLALALLASALVLIPNPMEQVIRQREQVQATIRQEAERINRLADELAAQEESQDYTDVIDALRAASAELQARQLSPDEARAALQRIEQQLLARQDPGTGELEDALAALAGSLATETATRDLGASLARGDMHQAAQEMQRLASDLQSLSTAEQLKLARSLRQAANQLSRSNSGLAQALQQAATALEQGQLSDAAQALNEAGRQLEGASSRLRSAAQRERALAQLQQSRSAINRSQQAAQTRAPASQRGSASQSAGDDGASGASSMDRSSGTGEGDPSAGDQPGGSTAGTGQGSHDETIYDPLMASGTPDFVPGQQPFDPDAAYQSQNPEAPYTNEAQVGYKQVFAQYQEKATQTLQNSYIPAGLKDIVKDYFSSLAPDR